MKKLFFLLITLILFACGSTNQSINYGAHLESIKTQQVQTSTMSQTITKFNSPDFSTYCYEKNLPRDIKKWSITTFINAETLRLATKYLYMTSNKNVYVMTLDVNGNDTTFIVTNRIQH